MVVLLGQQRGPLSGQCVFGKAIMKTYLWRVKMLHSC